MHTGGASSFPSVFLVPVRGDYVLLIEMEAINIYFEPMRKFTRTMQTSDKIHLFVYLPNMVACYNNLPNLLDAIKNLATNKKKGKLTKRASNGQDRKRGEEILS
jgi:hypothetical protein